MKRVILITLFIIATSLSLKAQWGKISTVKKEQDPNWSFLGTQLEAQSCFVVRIDQDNVYYIKDEGEELQSLKIDDVVHITFKEGEYSFDDNHQVILKYPKFLPRSKYTIKTAEAGKFTLNGNPYEGTVITTYLGYTYAGEDYDKATGILVEVEKAPSVLDEVSDEKIRNALCDFLRGHRDAISLSEEVKEDLSESTWPEVQCSIEGYLASPSDFKDLTVKRVGPGRYKYECVCPDHGDRYVDDYTISASINSDGIVQIDALFRDKFSPETDETIISPGNDEFPSASMIITNEINGHEWVDLGLSVKWATCNLGASSSSDYGEYYAWGETTTKNDYSWSTLNYCANTSGNQFYKYVPSDKPKSWKGDGTPDNEVRLDDSDDAAHVNWGGSWRMPTDDEWRELREKCTWVWTTLGGNAGYKITGKNGNSIFLPAAGTKNGTKLILAGSYCNYWSSVLNTGNPRHAWNGFFSSGDIRIDYVGRNCGSSVRPVTE